jgi:dCTP diphosphatase
MSDLTHLRDALREFTEERDWARFHDPKSLILALVGEVGELAELFQWLPEGRALAAAREEPLRGRVRGELSDVLLYLVRLADVLEVPLSEAAQEKLDHSSRRFNPAEVRGRAPNKM